MRFPARGDTFPTKDEMADYLQSYAQHFRLPVLNDVKVDELAKDGDRFVVTAGSRRFESENVVVAMANYQNPRIPIFARGLNPGIVQLHAHDYRNPSQLQEGGVLIVGSGNSGADIGVEVARSHRTWMAGKESGHVPYQIESFMGRFVLVRLIRFIGHHLLTVSTPIGRKMRPKMLSHAAPLVRVKPADLIAAGIERVPKVVGVRDGRPLLADDRLLDVKNLIWCTGYDPGFSWIHLPILGEDGQPKHDRGVTQVPGFYFVGLHFLYAMTSATLFGVGRDAKRVVKVLQQQTRARAQSVGNLRQLEVT